MRAGDLFCRLIFDATKNGVKYILKLILSINPAQTCEARHLTRYVGGRTRRAHDCLSSVLELIFSLEVTSPSPSLKTVGAKTLESKFHDRRQAQTHVNVL